MSGGVSEVSGQGSGRAVLILFVLSAEAGPRGPVSTVAVLGEEDYLREINVN